MTSQSEAIERLRSCHYHLDEKGSTTVSAEDIELLLAQRDRYEKALLEIKTGEYGDDAMRLAQEALRCE